MAKKSIKGAQNIKQKPLVIFILRELNPQILTLQRKPNFHLFYLLKKTPSYLKKNKKLYSKQKKFAKTIPKYRRANDE